MQEEWALVFRIAGGGFGITVMVLVALSLIVWVVGLVTRKTRSKGK